MAEALTISRSAPEGNAFNILGQVRKILIEADMVEEAEEYFFKATWPSPALGAREIGSAASATKARLFPRAPISPR